MESKELTMSVRSAICLARSVEAREMLKGNRLVSKVTTSTVLLAQLSSHTLSKKNRDATLSAQLVTFTRWNTSLLMMEFAEFVRILAKLAGSVILPKMLIATKNCQRGLSSQPDFARAATKTCSSQRELSSWKTSRILS